MATDRIIGAHLSASGNGANALKKIVEIGGNALQIFSASPRGWNFAKFSDEQATDFQTTKKELGVKKVYYHASYLINFADSDRIGALSRQILTNELKTAAQLDVVGSIVHLGSYKNETKGLFDPANEPKYETLLKNIAAVLEKSPSDRYFIAENAGMRKIGQTIDELAHILKDISDPRMRICLDTCHLHAAGYDLTSTESFEKFLSEFDEKIGLDKLEVWHVNDSRDPFGSLRDRHENLGEGHVGTAVFQNILNHPKTKNMSFIIETPGFDDKGPDKENMDILKSFIS
jgi:deoxyribonuclease-4